MDEDNIEFVDRTGFRTKNSGIKRWGGKFNAIPLLLSYFPRPRSGLSFIEVFAGSGVVSLNYANKQTVMNDTDNLLFSFLYVLSGVRFEERIMVTTNETIKDAWQIRIDLFRDFMLEMETVYIGAEIARKYAKREDIVGRAIYFYILNRNNFSGIIHEDRKEPFDYKLGPLSKLILYQNLIEFFRNNDVKVWDLDFREVLSRCENWNETPRQKIFLYLDPPYPSQGIGYDKKFTEQDTRDLASLLKSCKHHWVCSEEDCGLVQEVFAGCHIKKVKWTYNSGPQHTTKDIHELLISNRPFVKRKLGNLKSVKPLKSYVRK